MNPSLRRFKVADYLVAARDNIPEPLVSEAAFDDILEVAAFVPGIVTSLFGFECPLAIETGDADFLFCTARSEPDQWNFAGCQVLAGKKEDLDLPSDWLRHDAWLKVREFCLAWDNPEGTLADYLDNVWLEFDMGKLSTATPMPSMFFGLTPLSQFSATDRTQLSTSLQLLELLLGSSRVTTLEDKLTECFHSLHGDAHVFQVGAMLARDTDAVRICIRGLREKEIAPYLASLGWNGPTDQIDRLVTELSAFVDRIDVDLDVSQQVHGKIGLECYLRHDTDTRQKLEQFCAHLVDRGLCTQEKAEALVDYNGMSHESQKDLDWPDYLMRVSSLLGPRIRSVIFQNVHHIKLVFEDGVLRQAKGYLAIEHRWVDVGKLYRSVVAS